MHVKCIGGLFLSYLLNSGPLSAFSPSLSFPHRKQVFFSTSLLPDVPGAGGGCLQAAEPQKHGRGVARERGRSVAGERWQQRGVDV